MTIIQKTVQEIGGGTERGRDQVVGVDGEMQHECIPIARPRGLMRIGDGEIAATRPSHHPDTAGGICDHSVGLIAVRIPYHLAVVAAK